MNISKALMKMTSVLALMASFLGHANAGASCSKFIDGEDYLFFYDGCVLEVEKFDGLDFYLYGVKRKGDPSRTLITMYLGGAPDVLDFYSDKEKIAKKIVEKLTIEMRERQSVDGDFYEALIALPVNSEGRAGYFHIRSGRLTPEDLDLVKKIVFSIRAK
ncbi:hypothetical protein [Variovorax sp. PBL-H6]|uniref:hypothetical protein n=1 Tax=Variovorax sp. PBL-H6 TaxID=434009 RepID=UPI0013A58661|nr:hypothetical protein [Variovorax sp. PBL-H6]